MRIFTNKPTAPFMVARQSVFLILLLIHIIPIWLYDYFPSQDGPSHIYNARLMLQYFNPANYRIREFYQLNLSPAPNLLGHGILSILMTVTPPLIAEKILLTLIIGILPVSMAYLADAFDADNRTFSLMGFIFSHHNLLHMGFYNFSLGAPLSLFTLGFWLSHRKSLRLRAVIVFYCLAALTYFAHFVSFAILALALAVVTGFDLLYDLIHRKTLRYEGRQDHPDMEKSGGAFRRLLLHVGLLLPVLCLGFQYALATDAPSEDVFIGKDLLNKIFWRYAALVTYTERHEIIVAALWLLVFAAITVNVCNRVTGKEFISRRDSMLILCIILIFLFHGLPWWKNSGGWLNDRIFLYVALFFAFWLGRFPMPTRRFFESALIILSLLQLGQFCREYGLLQPELKEFVEAVHLIEPHSTVSSDVYEPAWSDAFKARATNVRPFHHTACYYGMGKDIVCLNNYEAKFKYFPINWRGATNERADYVVLWRYADVPDGYADQYQLVYAHKRLKLLRRK